MKKIILVLFIIPCSLLTVNAQLVQQEWVARYPGPGCDVAGPFLAVDRYGSSYIGGTHTVNDTCNILCVKYNSSGTQQWATLYKYPGYACFRPRGLAIDTSGNAFVISQYSHNCITGVNILTVKFNSSNGSVAWARTFVGIYSGSYPADIKTDRMNNIYVIGSADSSGLIIKYNQNGDTVWVRKYHPRPSLAGFGPCTIDDSLNVITTGSVGQYFNWPPPGGWIDTCLTVKYNTNGIFRWARNYYNYGADEGYKIVSDQYGSVYAAVNAYVTYPVYLTLKYDRNGTQQWASIYYPTGNSGSGIYAMAADRAYNAVFVTGSTSPYGPATIKYNAATGDSIWVRTYWDHNNGGGFDVKVDTSGNAYLVGGIGNSGGDVLTLKYSSQGSELWRVTYNGPFNGSDVGRKLQIDNQNNVYVLGYSQSSPTVSDYVTIKYSQLVGIQPISNEIPKEFKLEQNYPNPFNSKSNIKYQIAKGSFVTMKIFDVLGREVQTIVNEQLKPGIYEVNIDGTNLSSGVYFYKLTANGNVIDTKKLIIVK